MSIYIASDHRGVNLKEYLATELAKETNAELFIDVPFDFPHYILKHFNDNLLIERTTSSLTVGYNWWIL